MRRPLRAVLGASVLFARGAFSMKSTNLRYVSTAAIAFGLVSAAHAQGVLPDIQPGSIAIQLNTVASGLSAPDYAINAPGDPSRLFVVEQNGLLRVIQNGSLLPNAALDIRPLRRAAAGTHQRQRRTRLSRPRVPPRFQHPRQRRLSNALHLLEPADRGRVRRRPTQRPTARSRTTGTSSTSGR